MRNRSRNSTEADQAQTALGITGHDASERVAPPKKNRAAAALGRAGGLKGGRVRAQRMTVEQRRASAQKAAVMRWAKVPTAMSEPPEVDSSEDVGAYPPSPFAKFKGELLLGGSPIDCYVLDTGDRVVTLSAVLKTLMGVDASNLGDYIGVRALKPYINSDLILGETKDFHIPAPDQRPAP